MKILTALLLVLFVSEVSSAATDEGVHHIAVRFHLVTDMNMRMKGVAMTNWLTSEMIEKTVLPEVRRIWSAAKIGWTLGGVSPARARAAHRTDAIDFLLKAVRDSDGHGDPERIRRLLSILDPVPQDTHTVDIYVVPYLGGTSQGHALPARKQIFMGQWTDKPSHGEGPPQKCLLVESGEFQQGSLGRTVAHELGHILGLGHPRRNTPPYHRLMGGSKPGYELTEEEKATARRTVAGDFPRPTQP